MTRLKIAYADPPYPGQARKHYKDHADYAGEVDHAALVAQMVDEYPDGWALSTSTPALRSVLSLCPENVRVAAWVKPFCAFKVGVNPAYAWEPVIWTGGRSAKERGGREVDTVRDWVSTPITLKKGVSGAKPLLFCLWLFDLFGMVPDDELVDLFPGSGAVAQAWEQFRSTPRLSA